MAVTNSKGAKANTTSKTSNNANVKKLYRSRDNRMIAGVCAGIGEYTNTDPTVIRVLFVVFGLMSGWGLLAYLILALVVPEKP